MGRAGRGVLGEECWERRFPHLACGGVYLLPDTKTLFCHKRYLICDNIGKNTLYCHRFAFICDNTPLRNPHCHRITQIRDNTNTKHHYCHTSHKKCDSLVMRTLPAIHLPRQHAQEGPATRVSVDNSTKLLNLPHLPPPEHSGSVGTVLNELQEQKQFFQEKTPPQNGNVLANATIPGENSPTTTKHPRLGRKTRRKRLRRKKMSWQTPQFRKKTQRQQQNILDLAAKPGENASAERKCPGKRHNSRRKLTGSNKTSTIGPQNQEKTPPQNGNVLANATIPGENSPTTTKHPRLGRKTRRKRLRRKTHLAPQKKKSGTPYVPLAELKLLLQILLHPAADEQK